MLNSFIKAQRLSQLNKISLVGATQARSFYYPGEHHVHLQQEPHVLAKRIVKICGDRLRETDPHRWEGVPITFKTHWNNEAEKFDIRTCIQIHEAIEREFNIDIDDRKYLLQSVQDVFHFIMSVHAAV